MTWRGVDDDERQAVGGDAQRLVLGLVLAVDVREAEAAGAEDLRLVGGRAARRGADRRDRRRVDGALDAGAQGLLEHDPGAVDVDAEERVGAAAQRREPGDVEDARDAAQRAPDRRAVQDVGADPLDLEAVELLDARAGADGHAHAVAALDEQPRDVRADEAGRAGDEGDGHDRAGYAPTTTRSRRAEPTTLRPMPATPVAVVTDSTHYLPRELVSSRGIHVVSLYVNQGGVITKESDMPDFDAFYDGLRTSADLPTTSQPSIGDFLEVYEPLVAAGHDIVSIHISGGLSGTVESARQAAAELGGQRRIEVVDSQSTCGGLGVVVLAAQAAADGGADVEQVAQRAHEAIAATEVWFSLDTLEFVQRGGRIGRAQAWIGSALSIKPILSFADGTLQPVERVRTSRRALERMLDYLRAAQRGRRDGVVRPARAGARRRREGRRGRPRDLRHRAAVRHRARPGARHLRRPGHARHRRPAAEPAAVARRS